jgi:hypothetical protein
MARGRDLARGLRLQHAGRRAARRAGSAPARWRRAAGRQAPVRRERPTGNLRPGNFEGSDRPSVGPAVFSSCSSSSARRSASPAWTRYGRTSRTCTARASLVTSSPVHSNR